MRIKRGKMKNKRLLLLLVFIFLTIALTSQALALCNVDGIVKFANGTRVNGASVHLNNSGGYEDDTTSGNDIIYGDGYYGFTFTCSPGSYSTTRADFGDLWGVNTAQHPLMGAPDIWLNITITEHNAPIPSFGINVPNGEVTNETTLVFDAKCSDDVEVDAIRIYGSWGGGGWKATNMSPINNTYWNVSISSVSTGTWYIWCNDTSGNTGQTTTRSLTLDTSVAHIHLISPANGTTLTSKGSTQTISLAWNASDFDAPTSCSLYIGGTLETTKSCTPEARCSHSKDFAQNSTGIRYEWQVNCSDGSHSNTSEIRNFIAKTQSGGGGGGGGGGTGTCGDGVCNKSSARYTFNCTAEDYVSLSNISLFGNWNNWGLVETKTVSGNSANVLFSIDFSQSGSYVWNCYVCTSTSCEWLLSNQTIAVQTSGGGESYQNCCTDCGCLNSSYTCTNNACILNNETIIPINPCGNGQCQPEIGENCGTCLVDCACKSGLLCIGNVCVGCGDGLCSRPQENATSCPTDCNAVCGDKICEGSETFKTCCVDCGCPAGERCINNSCKNVGFPWWILFILLGILVLIIAYLIIKSIINKKNLMWLVLSIGREIDKKKFNEIQKKSKGKKMDYEKQNKKIEKYVGLGIGICKKLLKESIEKEEIQALKKFVEKKKELLHRTNLLFEDYKKIIKKERLAFEEDLKEILFSEEIPKYNELKKEVTNLNSIMKQIKAMKVTSFREVEE